MRIIEKGHKIVLAAGMYKHYGVYIHLYGVITTWHNRKEDNIVFVN